MGFKANCNIDGAWEIVMTFIWQVWNTRNAWVFEHKKLDPRLGCARTLSYLGEYEAAMVRETNATPPQHTENQSCVHLHKGATRSM